MRRGIALRKLLLVSATVGTPLFALQSPYLISATASSDSSIQLSWRNNDGASTGFILQRKDTTATAYRVIDSIKSAAQLSYIDSRGLKPAKLYTYQVQAYNNTSVSDTSNSLSATTNPKAVIPDTLLAPEITTSWACDTSRSVLVMLNDRSNCETGYGIYRAPSSSSQFTCIARIPSANPAAEGAIAYTDTATAANSWYFYKAAVYRMNDTLFCTPCSVYTLASVKPKLLPTFSKIGNFPISYGYWALKFGDSIYLSESNAPTSKISVVNVREPTNPRFEGYIDSAILVTYPQKTLIPVTLKYRLWNGYGTDRTSILGFNDRILAIKDSTVRLFKILNETLSGQDSFKCTNKVNGVVRLNDSTIGILNTVSYNNGMSNWGDNIFLLPIQISTTGFTRYNQVQCGYDSNFSTLNEVYRKQKPFIRGLIRSQIVNTPGLLSQSSAIPYLLNYTLISDVKTGQSFRLSKASQTSLYYFDSYSNPGFKCGNPGYNFSSTVFLSPDTAHLFAEDVADLNAYATAQSFHAVLPDSFGPRQAVIIDTAKKLLFVFHQSVMSTYTYAWSNSAIQGEKHQAPQNHATITVVSAPHATGVVILLPAGSHRADLCFFDLTGRLIDRMANVASNAVAWRPKMKSVGCYVVSVIAGKEKYTAKFLIK